MDYNVGGDVTLKRFLTLRADYYIQRTDDLLSNISVSYTHLDVYKRQGYVNVGFRVVRVEPWKNCKRTDKLIINWNAKKVQFTIKCTALFYVIQEWWFKNCYISVFIEELVGNIAQQIVEICMVAKSFKT